MDHNKLWKILKVMGIPDHLTCFLRNLYTGQEGTLQLDMKQWTGSKLGKEYVKAVYCHSAYLTYIQSTLCEIPDWFQIGKRVYQGCILSLCLFNLYTEYIM